MSDELRKKMSLSKIGMYVGSKNPKWRGGRMMVGDYWYIYSPNHPYKTKAKYVCEHRLVMEKKLGRYLKPEENIHHINHVKTDNRIENLMITDNYTHSYLHPEVHARQKIEFKGIHFHPETEFKKGYGKGIPKSVEQRLKIGASRRTFNAR